MIRSDSTLSGDVPGPREPFGGQLAAEVQPLLDHTRRRFGQQRAPEIVQDTLLQALRAESTYDPSRPLGPWLRTIARHVAGRLGRRDDAAPEALAFPEAVESPARDRVHAELAEGLLAKLGAADQALLRRHHMDGEPVASIAASLETPEGTIKARLWRARRRLAALAAASGGALLILWPGLQGAQPEPARLLSATATIVQRVAPQARAERRVLRSDAPGTWSVSGALLHPGPSNAANGTSNR